MTVARALYSDLVLNFTLGDSTSPTSTQVAAVITQLYKDAYAAAYGAGSYATYDASAEDDVIDTEGCKSIIIADAQDLVNRWSESFAPNSTKEAPRLRLSDEAADEIARLVGPRLRFASREDDDLEETGDSVL